ncbi:MAG: hypothetical protein WBQ94_26455, partial [Terracidiphilus sp.]
AYGPMKLRGKTICMAPKNPAAVALGRKGGKATAQKRTAEERSAAAKKAVEARWARLRELSKQIGLGTKKLLRESRAATEKRQKASNVG